MYFFAGLGVARGKAAGFRRSREYRRSGEV